MEFKRAILLIMDSVGVGALPDCKKFGDSPKYNTLASTAKFCGGLNLPNLESLGIGSLTSVKGVKKRMPKKGFAVKCAEKSAGKDTSTGHWEIAGLYTDKAFPTYVQGFPEEMIDRFIQDNDLPGILCNEAASGTTIIEQLGEESIKTGKPIVYTSADSVFQIAAHEEHFGLDRLYKVCESARKLCDEYRVGRVIARPFLGKNAKDFTRTSNRKDYSIELHGPIIFDSLKDKGVPVHTIGKISNIYNHQGISSNVPSKNNNDGMNKVREALTTQKSGVIMVNLVDFDQNYGHRRNPGGYGQCLEEFDEQLGSLLGELKDDDLLVLTADHGNDPTAHGTDHTREYVPFILHSNRINTVKEIKDRKTFADIGATIHHALTGDKYPVGTSLLSKLKLDPVVDLENLTAYSVLDKKKKGEALHPNEIKWFIEGLLSGKVTDYQMSALLMAIAIHGMNVEETAALTDAMLYSGKVLDFVEQQFIDKHSTGGVGDKTSFILAPIAAAAGVHVPMIAGRGLGHTGGTVDKIESVSGFQTSLTLEEFERSVKEDGVAMIGQTADIAPADKKIYALRDVTATIDSIPLITASIMSKKLAEGAKGLVLDIKAGNGAFMKNHREAKALAKSIMNTAKRFNKNSMVLITDMNQPLGNKIGNSLEIIESVETLQGKGPKDLTEISVQLAGAMIYLAGKAKSFTAGVKLAKAQIKNGKAFEVFCKLIERQGGDVSQIKNMSKLPLAKEKFEVIAKKGCYLKGYQTEQMGLLCVDLGGGRKKADDVIDFAVGFDLHKKIGDKIKEGESILTIYHHSHQKELVKKIANKMLDEAIQFSTSKVKKPVLILEKMEKWSSK